MAWHVLFPAMAALVVAPLGPAERVAAVSYRLQTRAASLCPEPSPMASFFIKDVDATTVDIVVANGPAARAGLRSGDVINNINGAPVPAKGVSDLIDAALDSGRVELQLSGGRRASFAVEQGCGYPVGQEQGRALDAYADGKAVALSRAIIDFSRDDDELGLIIAHELSHNILHHKALLDAAHVSRGLFARFGKSAEAIRKTEAEADVYGLYLLARAGYDISKAPAFWLRFGAKTGAGVLSDGTHLRTKARVALAEATVSQIRDKQANGAQVTPPIPLLK